MYFDDIKTRDLFTRMHLGLNKPPNRVDKITEYIRSHGAGLSTDSHDHQIVICDKILRDGLELHRTSLNTIHSTLMEAWVMVLRGQHLKAAQCLLAIDEEIDKFAHQLLPIYKMLKTMIKHEK